MDMDWYVWWFRSNRKIYKHTNPKRSTREVTAAQPSNSTLELFRFVVNERWTEPMSNANRIHWTKRKKTGEWDKENATPWLLFFLFLHWHRNDDDVVVVFAVVHERSSELAEINSLDTILSTHKKIWWINVDQLATHIRHVFTYLFNICVCQILFSHDERQNHQHFKIWWIWSGKMSFQPNVAFEIRAFF